MSSSIEERLKAAIPADFHMISACQDRQQGIESDVSSRGSTVGVCTAALLQVWYRHHQASSATAIATPLSWLECMRQLHAELQRMGCGGADQSPVLSSSHFLNVQHPLYIVPPSFSTGRKRALLIGINYQGQEGELSGCHNDVQNMKRYLIDVQGFNESEMLILLDDGLMHAPTRQNMDNGVAFLVQYSQPGDVVFLYYSGHGGRVRDVSGDEDDGYDSALVPLDYERAGYILDDHLMQTLVKPMRQGVTVTVVIDCSHSGTVLDLPYRFSSNDSQMRLNETSLKHIVPTSSALSPQQPLLDHAPKGTTTAAVATTGCCAPRRRRSIPP